MNNGTIAGADPLGTGINAFHNNPGARFDTGTMVDLGAGNTLANAGIPPPGGPGTIGNTWLIGNLIQLDSSILEIDIGGFYAGIVRFHRHHGHTHGRIRPLGWAVAAGGRHPLFVPPRI